MTKNYSQLTLIQRYQIEALSASGKSQTAIAKIINVNKSTICREMKRNVSKRGIGANVYHAQKAQVKTDHRYKTKPKKVLFISELKADVVENMTTYKLIPELISATWKKENIIGVSHETIYKFIWKATFCNGRQFTKMIFQPCRIAYRTKSTTHHPELLI